MRPCLSITSTGEWKFHNGGEIKILSGGLIILLNWDLTQTIHSAIIRLHKHFIMDYKPYSPEWHRKRHLKEALDSYFDDYVDTDVIREDLLSILSERSDKAYEEFMRINKLEKSLN